MLQDIHNECAYVQMRKGTCDSINCLPQFFDMYGTSLLRLLIGTN